MASVAAPEQDVFPYHTESHSRLRLPRDASSHTWTITHGFRPTNHVGRTIFSHPVIVVIASGRLPS